MQKDNLILIKDTQPTAYDLTNDYTLPDYIPDVKRLANVTAKAVLHNIFIGNTSITYEGEVIFSAMLICEDESIKNVIYSEDFSVEVSCDGPDMLRCHECMIDNSSLRLISPRKLNCKAKLSLFSKCVTEHTVVPRYTGTVTDETCFEKQYTQCEYTDIHETELSALHASHDIELTQDKEEISSVIYCNVDTNVNEQKYIDGRLYLRGETRVSVLYESVNSTYVKIQKRLPFSEIADGIPEFKGCICRIDVKDIRAAVGNNSFGEMKRIELDYTYDIKCRIYRCESVELIKDVYSTCCDTAVSFGSVMPIRFDSIINSNLTAEGEYAIDTDTETELEVIDCLCSIDDSSVNGGNGRIQLAGSIRFDIILKTEGIAHHCYTLPFKLEKSCECDMSELYSEHYVKICDRSAQINKGKLYLCAELCASVMIACSEECRYVERAETSISDDSDCSPMIIYYPASDETMWDVAKKFRCSCADIMSANSMTDDSLEGVKVLLLPRKKRRAVKSMII